MTGMRALCPERVEWRDVLLGRQLGYINCKQLLDWVRETLSFSRTPLDEVSNWLVEQ